MCQASCATAVPAVRFRVPRPFRPCDGGKFNTAETAVAHVNLIETDVKHVDLAVTVTKMRGIFARKEFFPPRNPVPGAVFNEKCRR
jgi:hypothetical protein